MEKNKINTELAALERILKRERLARKEAEKQLEDYTREIYEKEKVVVHAQEEVTVQQGQLEFLTGLLAETCRQPSLKNIVGNYLERTNTFMSNAHNVFVEIHADLSYHQFQYYKNEKSKEYKQEQLDSYKFVLKNLNRDFLYNQLSVETESQIFEQKSQHY